MSPQGRWVVQRHLNRLEGLKCEMAEVEDRLAEVTNNDALVKRLMKEPGIGPVASWTMRAEIGRFDRFQNGKQLARFCGLSPRNASSGARQADAGLIRAANTELRTVLIEARQRLARIHLRWNGLACKLREQGKPGSLIAAAVSNRWVRGLYHPACCLTGLTRLDLVTHSDTPVG